MARKTLVPQVPGEQPAAAVATTTTAAPEETAGRDELAAVLTLPAAEIIADLAQFTDTERAALRELEAAGDARADVLAALDGEVAPADPIPPADPAPVPQATAAVVDAVRVDAQPQPVLTAAGWVVPEPLPGVGPKVR